jgi:hypothetical protein
MVAFSLQFHVSRNICVEIEETKSGAYQGVRGRPWVSICILQYSLICLICKKKIPEFVVPVQNAWPIGQARARPETQKAGARHP